MVEELILIADLPIEKWVTDIIENFTKNEVKYRLLILGEDTFFRKYIRIENKLFSSNSNLFKKDNTSFDGILITWNELEKSKTNFKRKFILLSYDYQITKINEIKKRIGPYDILNYLSFTTKAENNANLLGLLVRKKSSIAYSYSSFNNYNKSLDEYEIVSSIETPFLSKLLAMVVYKYIGIVTKYLEFNNFINVKYIDEKYNYEIKIPYLPIYWVNILVTVIKNRITNAFNSNNWQIGVLILADHSLNISNIKSTNHILFTNPNNGFYADPFIINHGDNNYIFLEELNYDTQKGFISVIEIDNNGTIIDKKDKIISSPFHMSYPFLFNWKDKIYLIPETFEEGGLHIYSSDALLLSWNRVVTLFPEKKLIDSTLIILDGVIYLFCIEPLHKFGSVVEDLCIYFSDDLINGWKSHPMNPIKSNCNNSRPAGSFFYENGKLIRPTQNCAGEYGKKVNLNEVLLLNQREFKEIPYKESFFEIKNYKNHHFDFNKNFLVFDVLKIK